MSLIIFPFCFSICPMFVLQKLNRRVTKQTMLEKISSIYTNTQTKVYVSVAVKMLLKEIFPQLLKLLLRCFRICWRFCLDLTFFIVLRLKCDIIFLLQQRTNFLCIVVRIFSPSKKKKKIIG